MIYEAGYVKKDMYEGRYAISFPKLEMILRYYKQLQTRQTLKHRYEMHHQETLRMHQAEISSIQATLKQKEQETAFHHHKLRVRFLGPYNTTSDNPLGK